MHDVPTELRRFDQLQAGNWLVLSDTGQQGPRTVVVVPSVTIDDRELKKIPGPVHFEPRLLFLLQLLRQPETRLIYITSEPLPETVVEYALDLVPSLPNAHARHRLTLLDCGAGDATPLTAKILRRPRLIEQIRRAINRSHPACMVAFNNTPLERTLAVRLGLPLYARDPALAHLGTKSSARQLLRGAGVPVVDGVEDLRDCDDLVGALAAMRTGNPALATAVIKLNDGFGGTGNVLFPCADAPGSNLVQWIRNELPRRATFAAATDTWENFLAKLEETGGVVEHYIEAPGIRSPAVQLEIGPDRVVRPLSTHDQVLGGPAGQTFLGCTFPARPAYRMDIQALALRAGAALAAKSVAGIVSIDFISGFTGSEWRSYALDVNVRMGGGTAPYFMMHGLLEGAYLKDSGEYVTPEGEPRYYVAFDRLQRDAYRTLGPDDVIDIAVRRGRHYRDASKTGTAFYMLGGLAQVGRLGIVAIDKSPDTADALYRGMIADLDAEAGR